MVKKEHIVISKEIKKELDKLGSKGNTYEDIIKILLKEKKYIFPQEIVNYNCNGLCLEKSCGQKATYFFNTNVNDNTFIIPICKQHAEILENSKFVKCSEPPVIECEEREDLPGGVKFHCQYCGKDHLHGIGEGHRNSHCIEDSPYKETGYILKLKRKT